MRLKINDDVPRSSYCIYSDLYKQFSKFFDQVLDIAKQVYISDMALEAVVIDRLNTDDNCQIVIGFTGIGKSTLIQHILPTTDSVTNSSLFISFDFNRDGINVEVNFQKKIESASESILKANPKLISQQIVTEDDLADFIDKNKKSLLGISTPPDGSSFSEDFLNLKNRISNLKKENPSAYWLERLKYLLVKAGNIENVYFIIDNIEGHGYEYQCKIIFLCLHAHRCLLNLHEGLKRTYKVKFLLAIRPETLSAIKNDQNEHKLDSYNLKETPMDSPPSMYEVFEDAFKIYNANSTNVNNRDAESALMFVAESLDKYIKNSLLMLCNFNIREAFEVYLAIMKNRFYFQQDKNRQAAFKLDKWDYHINDAAIYSALAIPFGAVYIDDERSVIANILHNDENVDSDLLIPYIIKWILHRSKRRNWYTPVNMNEFKNIMKAIFAFNGLEKFLENELLYMKERNLLRTERGKEHLVSLTPRGLALWEIIGKSGILLTLYREDIVRDFSRDGGENKISDRLSTEKKYIDLCHLLMHYCMLERKYIEDIVLNKKLDSYCFEFGTSLIIPHLYGGFRFSYDQFFRDPERISSELKEQSEILKKTIIDFEKYFNSLT